MTKKLDPNERNQLVVRSFSKDSRGKIVFSRNHENVKDTDHGLYVYVRDEYTPNRDAFASFDVDDIPGIIVGLWKIYEDFHET